jgi:hypothetical protein
MTIVNTPNDKIASQKTFPFAPIPKAYHNMQPYLGARILITNITAASGTSITLLHNLKAIPKSLIILHVNGIFSPKWMPDPAKPWTSTNIYVIFDENITPTNNVTLMIF